MVLLYTVARDTHLIMPGKWEDLNYTTFGKKFVHSYPRPRVVPNGIVLSTGTNTLWLILTWCWCCAISIFQSIFHQPISYNYKELSFFSVNSSGLNFLIVVFIVSCTAWLPLFFFEVPHVNKANKGSRNTWKFLSLHWQMIINANSLIIQNKTLGCQYDIGHMVIVFQSMRIQFYFSDTFFVDVPVS